MGDSTTDEIVEAVNLWNRLRSYHTQQERGLAGVNPSNIVSFGHDGSKLAGWWAVQAWKNEITTSGAHLIILSYGINDIRLGATTQAALRALLMQAVNYIRKNMPTTDICFAHPRQFRQRQHGHIRC